MKQPLAYVHPEAQIADNVVIEPFVTIDKNVVIEEGTRIGSNAHYPWRERISGKL